MFPENIALNQNSSDIKTLITYLKSQKLLKTIAEDNNISPSSLIGKVNISLPASEQSQTLLISVEGENKFQLRNVLDKLSNGYILAAYAARKNQISEGIKFLENQEVISLKKVGKTKKELEDLRLKNNTIDPITEGEFIKQKIVLLEDKITSLTSENVRLEFINENLEKGILMTKGIVSENILSDSNYLDLTNADQALLEEMLEVKAELAKSRSIFKESSIIIQNLKSKLSQLEPILIENQKSAITAAITQIRNNQSF